MGNDTHTISGIIFGPANLRRTIGNVRDTIGRDGVLFAFHLLPACTTITLVGAEPYAIARDNTSGTGAGIVTLDTLTGVTHESLQQLGVFLGTIRDLKTQPGTVRLTAGHHRLIWLDEATGETHETPTMKPHTRARDALNMIDTIIPLPPGSNGFNIGPDRLSRLSRTSGGTTKYPLSILFAGFPGDTEKIPQLMCVKHGPTFRALYPTVSTQGMIQYLNKEQPDVDIQQALW